jgi:hypothetical protein
MCIVQSGVVQLQQVLAVLRELVWCHIQKTVYLLEYLPALLKAEVSPMFVMKAKVAKYPLQVRELHQMRNKCLHAVCSYDAAWVKQEV